MSAKSGKSSRRSAKGSSRRSGMDDAMSVRMKIDGVDDITDLSTKSAVDVKKQLILEVKLNKRLDRAKRLEALDLLKADLKALDRKDKILVDVDSDEDRHVGVEGQVEESE